MLDPVRNELTLESSSTFCERIICLHQQENELGWWHQLEIENQLLFAPGGRIRETLVENAIDEVRQSIEDGFKPILFLSNKASWPEIAYKLGRYRVVTGILHLGRDNQLMTQLLHNPSSEIMQAYLYNQKIVPPNLEYARALDRRMEYDLEDFIVTAIENKSDPLLPTIQLRCRSNPFRFISLRIFCKSGVFEFKQFYRDQENNALITCNLPVRFDQWHFRFINGRARIEKQFQLLDHICSMFDLPAPYRNWCTENELPWQGLLSKLRQIASGSLQFLNGTQQALLQLADPAKYIRQGMPYQRQKAESVDTLLPPVMITGSELLSDKVGRKSTLFSVRWTRHTPVKAPYVLLTINGNPVQELDFQWNEHVTKLTIFNISIIPDKVGWQWNEQEQQLQLSIEMPV